MLRTALAAGMLAALALAAPARAQLTITEADIDAQLSAEGLQQEYSAPPSAALTTLANATGADQTWDFSGLPFTLEFEAIVAPAEPPVPGSDDPHLDDATHITRVDPDDGGVFYTFSRLSDDEYEVLGISLPDTLVKFIPGDLVMPLPLSIATGPWESEFETEFDPGFPGVTFTTERSGAVVGWGTLITPAGSDDALMIRYEFVSTTTVIGFPPIVTSSSLVAFYTTAQHQASISIDDGGDVTGGFYSVFSPGSATEPPAGSPAALRLDPPRPNPAVAGEPVTLAFSLAAPGPVRVEVFDVLGRQVDHLGEGVRAAGQHTLSWQPDVRPGLYVVRLTAGDHTATQRLTLTR